MGYYGASGGAAAPAFTPADLSNGILWLDFNDSANSFTSGGKYTSATCKFGTLNDPFQSTDSKRPTQSTLNGLNCADFDGTSQFMDFFVDIKTGNQAPFSIFFAGEIQGSGTQRTLLCIGSGPTRLDCLFPNNSNKLQVFPEPQASETIAANTTGVWGAVFGEYGTTEALNYFRDGEFRVSYNTGSNLIGGSGTRLGAFAGSETNYWNGKLGEIIVINNEVTVAEAGNIMTYLSDKWVP